MSTVVEPTKSSPESGPRLTEGQRHLIVNAVLNGERQTAVAKRFNVHPNTVNRLLKSVRNTPQSGLSSAWREKLTNELPAKSVNAIELSILDTVDVHKAASTAIAHLKGIGALQGDQATINVMVNAISSLPPDLAGDYLDVESTTTSSNDSRHNTLDGTESA